MSDSDEQRLDQVAMKHFYDDKLHDATQPSQRRSVHCVAAFTLCVSDLASFLHSSLKV